MKPIFRPGFALLFLLSTVAGLAQTKFTINGYVKDSTTGESIIGATININGKSVGSNQYGFYSITLDSGDYDLSVSHVSFLTQSQRIQLSENLQLNLFLLPKSAALSEVV
ncbi:MAG: carboxypeptidase-like regulatory domain-containing protein, partial [Chitinophagaceae bacterium]